MAEIFCPFMVLIVGGLCFGVVQILDVVYDETVDLAVQFVQYIKDLFYVGLQTEFTNVYDPISNNGKFKEAARKLLQRIEAQFEYLRMIDNLKLVILFLILIWVLYKSNAYRKKFIKFDNFDNCYISDEILQIDAKRAKLGLEILQPLYTDEKMRYPRRDSIYMNTWELINLLKNYLILLLFLLQVFLVASVDYLLYAIINFYILLIEKQVDTDTPFAYLAPSGKLILFLFVNWPNNNFSVTCSRL